MLVQERQAIVAACQEIVTAFAYHADLGDVAQCAALFTEDGVFERRGEALVGRAAILHAFQNRHRLQRSRHHCLAPHLVIEDAHNVRGTTYFAIYRHYGDEPLQGPAPLVGPAVVGEFLDHFVHTGNEGWRLRSRRTNVAFYRGAD
jgi:hypothetical protein